MDCEEIAKLLGVYLDGELDPVTSQSIEQHLQDCASCERAYQAENKLVRTIEHSVPYYKASSELRSRIHGSLQKELGSNSTSSRVTQPAGSNSFGTSWHWLAIAAAIVLTAIVTWNVAPHQHDRDQLLATQLIASHVRSLMANHLTDVKSSDQHTVKPWLDEKLDFAAPVVDLATNGFPLVGGRLDYFDNRPVAALVYQRRKHFINLFIWLAEPKSSQVKESLSHQGYHLLHWTDPDFNYWAVSDVSADDLLEFKQLFEKQLPRR
jgi:mycothiol system anti-sigma-R factor